MTNKIYVATHPADRSPGMIFVIDGRTDTIKKNFSYTITPTRISRNSLYETQTSKLMELNDVLWNGLGASLGGAAVGAIAGGFFGSFLQAYYSDRSAQKKHHFNDLKSDVINPLIETIKFDFKLSNLEPFGFSMKNSELRFSDLHFDDFITNHYPDICSKLEDFIGRSLDVNNKKADLCNKSESKLSNVFDNLDHLFHNLEQYQVVNSESKNTLVKAILTNYDKSFLRITNYGTHRYLYFYPVEDNTIAFKEANSYLIFSSALSDEGANTKNVNEVKSTLVQNIEEIRNQLQTELESYRESNSAFINSKNTLLQRLMMLKYTTKLNFEKKWIRRKCQLV
jgi:hypothetical protein